jgi:hypothetical protein
MNGRFVVAWLVVFVVWMIGSFVVHGMLLGGEYARLGALYRSPADQQRYFAVLLLAHVIAAGAFVWIYRQGIAAKPFVGQGVRYGVAVALLTAVPTYLIYYAVQPLPGGLVVRQIVGDTIVILVLGVLVAWLHREQPGRRAS